jgi:hypothetical protein
MEPTRVHAAGVDVVDVERLGLALRRVGPALEQRICTPAESATLGVDPTARLLRLAALFGVKESVFKALGGIPRHGRFTDIDAPLAGPVHLTGAVGARARDLGVVLSAGTGAAPEGTALAWALACTPVRTAS